MNENLEQEKPLKKKKRRWFFWLLLLLVLLPFIIALLLRLQSVQNWTAGKVTSYLENKIDRNISFDKIYYNPFSGSLDMENWVLHGETEQDTLFSLSRMGISVLDNIGLLWNNRYHLNSIDIEGSTLRINKESGEQLTDLEMILKKFSGDGTSTSSDSEGEGIQFSLRELNFSDIAIFINDENNEASSVYKIDNGSIVIDSMDMETNYYSIGRLELGSPYVKIVKGLDGTITTEIENLEEVDVSVDSLKANNLQFFVKDLSIDGGSFIYKDLNKADAPVNEESINFSDFSLLNIELAGKEFDYSSVDGLYGNDLFLSFVDNKGFAIEHIKSEEVIFTDTEMTLEGFILRTDRSSIDGKFGVSFENYEAFKNFTDDVYWSVNVDRGRLALDEFVHFVPDLAKRSFFAYNVDKSVNLSGKFRGVTSSLSGRNIALGIQNQIDFQGNFGTYNLTETDNAVINLKVEKLNSSVQFLRNFIPSFSPPENFNKLGKLNFRGRFDGFIKDFVAAGSLTTELGRADMDMRLDVKQGSERANYSGEMRLIDFDLQSWSDNDELGKVTFYANVKEGQGLTLKDAIADVEANVEALEFKGYLYEDFKMDGKLAENVFNGAFSIQDDNINLDFEGDVSYKDSTLVMDVKADVRELDLQSLNFLDKRMKVSGIMDFNIQGNSVTDLVGVINGRDIVIDADSLHRLDTFYLYSYSVPQGKSKLLVDTDLGQLKIEGQFRLDQIVSEFKKTMKRNYPYHAKNLTVSNQSGRDQDFRLSMDLYDSKNFLSLAGIPDLRIKNLRLKGSMDSQRENLNLDSNIEYIGYKDTKILNVDLSAGNQTNNGFLVLNIDSSLIAGRKINPIFLESDLNSDQINFNLATANIIDSIGDFNLKGNLVPHERGYALNIDNQRLEMLGKEWDIFADNEIIVAQEFLEINDLSLTDGYRVIEIADINNRGIDVQMKQFDFSILNGIIDYDKIDFTGEGDLKIKYDDVFTGEAYLQSNLRVGDFRLNEESYGVLEINLDRDQNNNISGLVAIDKDEQVVKASFNYEVESKNISGDIKARNFPVNIFDYIVGDGISETIGSGDVNGRISGTIDDIKVFATAYLKDAGVKIDYLGTSFFMDRQLVEISENYVNFNGVQITDIEGNRGRMSGGMNHDFFSDFNMDLQVEADKAVIINTTKSENPIYYGYGVGEVSVSFKGTFGSTDMKIDAITGPGTVLNIPVGYSTYGYEENFIKFVNKEDLLNNEDTVEQYNFVIEGLDIEMNLEMTEFAKVNIIFDEKKGDVIQGQGNGDMQIYVRRSGEFEVFGDYEVTEGEYLFTSRGVVAKPFNVRRGGRIRWTGDPVDASLDIVADYGIRASLDVFLDEFFTTAPESLKQEARNRQQVNLIMNLGGNLYAPEVTFDLDFPGLTGELRTFADTKLRSLKRNKIALNNQVAYILTTNQFLPTNNLAGEIFGDEFVQSAVASNLSEFVASQLSLVVTGLLQEWLSENGLIAGIDFNIGIRNSALFLDQENNADIYPDEIEVNVNNRFRFLNERLSLGTGVTYVRESQVRSTDYYVPEFVIAYYLTDDRKLKLRVYGRYDIDEITPDARRQKYGFGIGYRREFGSLVDFKMGLGEDLKIEKSGNENR